MNKKTYWNEERLNELTIEDAMEDYKFGFYTSNNADKHIIVLGTQCIRCGEEHSQLRTVGKRLASVVCDKCPILIKL